MKRAIRHLALVAILFALPAQAASELGKVDFPTSATPPAQAHFLRGVAALHSFWYDEAADAFREAQKAEPGFALAYWGEALTYHHPIWAEQDLEAARAALNRLASDRAGRLAKAPTEREKGFLDTVEILYGEGDKTARERDRALIEAAALLEELVDRNAEHPGVLHYLIHSYDDPLHAPLGLRAARVYAKVAPEAHHALHMPSHIFVQLGDWPSTAASNEVAWAASVDWVKRRELAIDKQDYHSLSWLTYAYLQQGRYGKAKETLAVVREAAKKQDSDRIRSAVQEMEARYAIETRSWDHAVSAAGGAEGGSGCHAASPGRGEGARLLAKGLGAARRGDLAAAEAAAAGLRSLAEKAEDSYRDGAPGVMEKEVSGLVALAKGNTEEALKLLAEAAELEARMGPPSGPPEPLKPAQELYGEVLLEQGRAKEAAEQFAQALLRMPNRAASLLGAARAAVKLGDGESARRAYGRLAEIWRQADSGSAELAEVKGYLDGAVARGGR